MINISMCVLRVFGEPRMYLEEREAGHGSLILEDTADAYPAANSVTFSCINADSKKIARAVEAFNREMNND